MTTPLSLNFDFYYFNTLIKIYFQPIQQQDSRGFEASNPSHEGATCLVCTQDEFAAFL
jgi:hypothetical protein